MRTSYRPGVVVWRELVTPDPERARGYYGELFGWKFDLADMGAYQYTLIKLGERQIGGIAPMTMQAPPHWMSYVSVADVDSAAAEAKKRGGNVPAGPLDIPNVGRFAVIGDPDGAYIAVLRGLQGDPPAEMPPLASFCWETLITKNVASAKEFYEAVFPWKIGAGKGLNASVPIAHAEDGTQVADIQKAQGSPPAWLTYVVVEKLESANERAQKLGGKIVIPLIDVPEVGRFSLAADPQGAHLGLFEPKPR
jgi:uncharacterized protein